MNARLPETGRPAGVVTSGELRLAGFSKAAIGVLVRRGDLTPLRRGAYARADLISRRGSGELNERALAIAAAVACAGRDAVASFDDAAVMHGVALLGKPPTALITVTRPDGHDGLLTGSPSVRVRRAALPRDHVTVRSGVPVTSAARTVVDLARTTSFRSGVVVADSALYRGKTSAAALDAVISSCRHWPGIDLAKRVMAFSDARSESPFETIARVAFHEGGLPPPELQVWVGDDRPIGRADFLWRQQRTIAEADGAMKYSDPDRARQQLHRDAELRAAGFEVVHFSWRELTASPGQVIGWIGAAFERADALRRAGRRSN